MHQRRIRVILNAGPSDVSHDYIVRIYNGALLDVIAIVSGWMSAVAFEIDGSGES